MRKTLQSLSKAIGNKTMHHSSLVRLPFQNTTQDSTTIGDSLTFLFTGTLSYEPIVIGGGTHFWLGQSATIYGVSGRFRIA